MTRGQKMRDEIKCRKEVKDLKGIPRAESQMKMRTGASTVK